MDNRFRKINRLLSEYSLGNFDMKLGMSPRMDEVDAFISGVNMLGEELKDKTISRDYFNDIFNSVSDMVFVLNKQGKIENINHAVTNHLQYSLDFLKGKPINYLLDKLQPDWFSKVLTDLRGSRKISYETVFKTKNKNNYPVLISASFLIGGKNLGEKILITAKDISDQKKTQNIVLKAIIETEEKERMRLAKDLHDSVGQHLSAIKFYIGTSADAVEDPKQKSILLKANAALVDVQADMRNICFNIMPKSLEVFGLIKAVEELCSKDQLLNRMKIVIKESNGFPRLPLQQEFALFRIIQEFISNALKHSRADSLWIEFRYRKKFVFISLADNGIGFDLKKIRDQGMGLNNVRSRIRPYNGEVDIISRPGKGTLYEISVPIEKKQ
ncbi:MAG TPA: PAS domain-containing sensor histidine kinase [Chitinophagaceae bacterium]|nr:PAS domain-containing sensor histidine kinase [Chitinophagaceae bacterium]